METKEPTDKEIFAQMLEIAGKKNAQLDNLLKVREERIELLLQRIGILQETINVLEEGYFENGYPRVTKILYNMYQNALLDYKTKGAFNPRVIAGIEATLVILNVLKPGQPFEFGKKSTTFKFLGFSKTFTTKESYNDLILRKAEEALTLYGYLGKIE